MFKRLWRKIAPNPLDVKLNKARRLNTKTILITWNRGLGDIPLGLYALIYRIREYLPDCSITFLTRKDLLDGFALLNGVGVLLAKDWKRGVRFDLSKTLKEIGLEKSSFDLVLENPDPTYWVKWQLGRLTPKLQWNSPWDEMWRQFGLDEKENYVGVHLQTETSYGYEKNWPLAFWKELIDKLIQEKNMNVVLFGTGASIDFIKDGIIDLRGKTTLYEMLSIIKNRLSYLIVPDSGILSLTYYLDVEFPLKIISLWADPRQGVLKQNVPSPNTLLKHMPLLGLNENVSQIAVDDVLNAMNILEEEDALC